MHKGRGIRVPELKIADVQKVMDGAIDPFIQAYLKQESEEQAEGRPL